MIKEKKILFSIIIPTYNRADFIPRAIQSVLEQKYENWELIIIDDGSTDNTKEKCYGFSDHRIKYYFQKNKGRSFARNTGIQKSTGTYVSFLDDDDYYYPNYLLEMYSAIKKQNYNIATFMCAQDEEQENGKIVTKNQRIIKIENQARFILKNANNFQPFCTSKSILKKINFDSRFELGEDFHLMLRIVLQFPLHYISKSLCVYKIHSNMTMKNEFENVLSSKYKYNRLDALEDLLNNYNDGIKKYRIKKLLIKRYNKIVYFYSSYALNNCNLGKSLYHLKSIKFKPFNWKIIYYKLSIYSRLFVNYFKCKM